MKEAPLKPFLDLSPGTVGKLNTPPPHTCVRVHTKLSLDILKASILDTRRFYFISPGVLGIRQRL